MQNKRNIMIDIAKLIFSICIVANHTNSIMLKGEDFPIVFRYGFLGVEFFFIVSGYLMYKKAEQIDLGETRLGTATEKYIMRKLSIVFPYLFVSWLFSFVVYQVGEKNGFHAVIKNLLQSVPTLLQINLAGFGGYEVNGTTWYISAMLICMLILFPIACSKKEIFAKIYAPLIVIFLYGYIIKTNGNYAIINPKEGGVIYYGLLRGLAGISLGCISCNFAKKISQHQFTLYGKKVLTAAEIASYLSAIYCMHSKFIFADSFRTDIIVVLYLFIAVTISFSQKSNTAAFFKGEHSWIGKVSLCIYLGDAPARKLIQVLMPEKGHYERLIPSLIAVVFVGAYVYFAGNGLLKISRKVSNYLSNKMIEQC